jgi:hypothetical protein
LTEEFNKQQDEAYKAAQKAAAASGKGVTKKVFAFRFIFIFFESLIVTNMFG